MLRPAVVYDVSMTLVNDTASVPPLTGPMQRASSSAAVLRDCVRELAVTHDVEPLGGRLDGLATGATLGEVHLAFVRYGAPTRVVADATGHTVCWTVPVGQMRVSWGRTPTTQAFSQGFALAQDSSTTMFPNPRQGAVVLTTTEDVLLRHHTRVTGRTRDGLDLASGAASGPSTGLIDLAWRHAAHALALHPIPAPALRRSLEESLLTAMLLELPGPVGVEMTGPEEPASLSRAHALAGAEWARAHLGHPVSMTQWADAVGVSVRHLQKCFREEFGCTPREYLLRLRLERAQVLLRSAPAHRTITSIATEAGFTHLGRFSADYRAAYGRTPTAERRTNC